jgi:hypothetical protein
LNISIDDPIGNKDVNCSSNRDDGDILVRKSEPIHIGSLRSTFDRLFNHSFMELISLSVKIVDVSKNGFDVLMLSLLSLTSEDGLFFLGCLSPSSLPWISSELYLSGCCGCGCCCCSRRRRRRRLEWLLIMDDLPEVAVLFAFVSVVVMVVVKAAAAAVAATCTAINKRQQSKERFIVVVGSLKR